MFEQDISETKHHSQAKVSKMGFRDIFRKNKGPQQALSEKHGNLQTTTSNDFANIEVAGMQRTNQGTYTTTYSITKVPQKQLQPVISSLSSDSTAVDKKYVSKHGESTWQNQPKGKAYDKREELTEEDKDMWANMAM